jgi:hypothetical protein
MSNILKDRIELLSMDVDFWKARADKAEAERDALKKDARLLALAPEKEWWSDKVKEAARRILAATEGK